MTHPLGDIRHHFLLAQSMAKVTGVDLIHAMHEGHISQGTWANAVTRCRGCDWAEPCEAWLAAQNGSKVAVPPNCANAELFQRLAG